MEQRRGTVGRNDEERGLCTSVRVTDWSCARHRVTDAGGARHRYTHSQGQRALVAQQLPEFAGRGLAKGDFRAIVVI